MSSTARRFTRCCDAQGASALVFAKMPFLPPVVLAALIVRSVPQFSESPLNRKNAISVTRRRTRCCDAQGAGAVVSRFNAISTALVVAALIVRDVPFGRVFA